MENNGVPNIKDKFAAVKNLMNMHDDTAVLVLSLMMWIIIIIAIIFYFYYTEKYCK